MSNNLIVKPFGRVLARIVIEIDQNNQARVTPQLINPIGAPTPMHPLQVATILAGIVHANLAGAVQPAPKPQTEEKENSDAS